MWECSYAKEPFDGKLMLLQLIWHIWIPLAAVIAGAAVFGSSYFIGRSIVTGGEHYAITTQYEVTYGTDPQTDNVYTYINDATWNSWVTTDLFIGMVQKHFEDSSFTKQQLASYLSASLATNLSMPSTTVTTPDLELTKRLNQAVQQAFMEFGEYKMEINKIVVVDTAVPELVEKAPRLPQAIILGGIAGGIFSLFLLFCKYCMEEAIWIPETFIYRFGIPMAGAIAKTESTLQETEKENLLYLLRQKKKIAVTAVDEQVDIKAVTMFLSKLVEGTYIPVSSIEQNPKEVEKLRDADGILLVIKAGKGNGRRVEHFLETLKIQDCKVTAALLWQADRNLLNAYYFPKSFLKVILRRKTI